MEADAFITLVIGKVDQVEAADGDNTDLRAERLNDLIEVAEWFVHEFDWSWMMRTGTVAISAAASSGTLPSDFHNFGSKGGVFDPTTGAPLDYVPPDRMRRRQLDPGDRPSAPDEYSIWDTDATGLEKLQTPVLSADVTFPLLYIATLPTITDAATGSLKKIPEKYQYSVLFPAMKACAKHSVGDGRYERFQLDPSVQSALKRAIKADRKGKEQTFQMPSVWGD